MESDEMKAKLSASTCRRRDSAQGSVEWNKSWNEEEEGKFRQRNHMFRSLTFGTSHRPDVFTQWKQVLDAQTKRELIEFETKKINELDAKASN